jgi:DNA-binding response OmpR family regulator
MTTATTMTMDSDEKKRILLVDDEHDIALAFKISLENNGFTVDAFNDPEEALSNFEAGLYDLLLVDIKMPQRIKSELVTTDTSSS